MIVPVLLSGLLGLFAVAPVSVQDRPRRPKDKDSATKDSNREKLENLVKLPDDFVQFARVPEGGTSPRIGRRDDQLALIFFKGEATQGDLYLTRSSDEAKTFLPSVQINSEAGTVAALEGVHRASVDVGPDGSAHVVWITSGDTPRLLYARAPAGAAPAANVDLGAPPGLCSSAAVAVDATGQVFAFYAASVEAESAVESSDPPHKRVWMRRSTDGVTFSEPIAIDDEGFNVSDLSAMAAHVDELMGTVFVLYRSAYATREGATNLARGMRLLSSDDHGGAFKSVWVDNWKQTRDPRSSAGLTQDVETTLATWDSGGQVYWATIRRQVKKVNLPMDPRADGPEVVRTHPAGAGGGTEIMLAWIERPKEDREAPPRLAWRVWLREGRAPIGGGYAPEPPGLATPTVLPRKGHGFTVLY